MSPRISEERLSFLSEGAGDPGEAFHLGPERQMTFGHL